MGGAEVERVMVVRGWRSVGGPSKLVRAMEADLAVYFPADAEAPTVGPFVSGFYVYGWEGESGGRMCLFTFATLQVAKAAEEVAHNWRYWDARTVVKGAGRKGTYRRDPGWAWWTTGFLRWTKSSGDGPAPAAPAGVMDGPCRPNDRPVLHGMVPESWARAKGAGLGRAHGLPTMGWLVGFADRFWPDGVGKGGATARSTGDWGGRVWRTPPTHDLEESSEEEAP